MKPAVTYAFVASFIVLFVLLALSYSGGLDKREGAAATPTEFQGSLGVTARLQATLTKNPTQTPLPTYTPYPTYTPFPTATLIPTATLEPTSVVGGRARPAALGEAVTVTLGEERYAVSITQVLSGAEAARRLADANRFNKLPGEGQEYLLFYAVVEILRVPGEGKVDVSEFDFSMVDGDGRVWNPPSFVDPEPQLQGSGFAGATVEGWGTHLRRVGESVQLVFGMSWDGAKGVWFSVP